MSATPLAQSGRQHGADLGPVQRCEAGRDAGHGDPVGQPVPAGERVRSGAGPAEHGEPVQAQVVGERFDIGDPLDRRPYRQRVGQSDTGPVHGDETDAEGRGAGVVGMAGDPRVPEAVEQQDRPAAATAVLRRAVAHHELTARWIAETLERLD